MYAIRSYYEGSITEAERKIMKEHAYMTLKMLSQIPFTKKFRNIPNFAGAHHECVITSYSIHYTKLYENSLFFILLSEIIDPPSATAQAPAAR